MTSPQVPDDPLRRSQSSDDPLGAPDPIGMARRIRLPFPLFSRDLAITVGAAVGGAAIAQLIRKFNLRDL